MSDILVIGGRRLTDLYRVQENATKTGYDILDKLTTTVAAAPTTTDAALSATLTKGTDIAYQEDGTCKLTLEQYNAGQDIWDFLDKVAVPGTTVARPEITLENGDKFGGSAGSGDMVLAISYLFFDDDSNKTKVFTHAGLGRISPTSGSFKTDSDNYVQPTFEFTSISTAYSLTITKAMFRETMLDSGTTGTVTDQTIASGKGFWRKFLTKAVALT
jgi:hypothetical protein